MPLASARMRCAVAVAILIQSEASALVALTSCCSVSHADEFSVSPSLSACAWRWLINTETASRSYTDNRERHRKQFKREATIVSNAPLCSFSLHTPSLQLCHSIPLHLFSHYLAGAVLQAACNLVEPVTKRAKGDSL